MIRSNQAPIHIHLQPSQEEVEKNKIAGDGKVPSKLVPAGCTVRNNHLGMRQVDCFGYYDDGPRVLQSVSAPCFGAESQARWWWW